MGWEETHLKGWGLKAMKSELTQIFIDSDIEARNEKFLVLYVYFKK